MVDSIDPATNYQLPTIPPLIVVVGQTASGKSALATELAKQFDGEIICADSRTVYKGMDIGTAKPTAVEKAKVPHHLLDIVEPGVRFTAGEFKARANHLTDQIVHRGKVPLMVGGTGLYVDAALYDYTFANTEEAAKRDPQNPRHLLAKPQDYSLQNMRSNTLVLGVAVDREELKERIANRVESMIKAGLEDEVSSLEGQYGWESEALTGIGYREWRAYFDGKQTLDETKKLIIKNTLGYAKRQKTWFKRNKSIQWVTNTSQTAKIVADFLSKNSAAKQ